MQGKPAGAPEQYRQGDVLLERVDTIPATAKKRDPATRADCRVLALGETSGHGHIVTGTAEIYDDGDTAYIEAEADAAVEHLLVASGIWTKEHRPIPLQAGGRFRVVPQRQFNPYARAIERVID